jgi:hypothetical protein
MRLVGFVIAVLAAGPALAGSVSDEVAVNSAQSTGSSPRSGYLSDALNANFDLTEQLSLNAGAMITVEGRTPAAASGGFGTSESTIIAFTTGLDWDPTENWSLGATLDVSPRSTQYVGTQVQLTTNGASGEALLRSQTSSYDGAFDLSYDTAGDSNLEFSFIGGVTFSHLATDQNVSRVRNAETGAASTPQQIRDYCASHKCPSGLLQALRPQTGVTLDSQRFSLGATATVARDTDLVLSGDYYHYQQDPTAVGFFSIASVGHFGAGLPIAPLQYTIRPEVSHRFGDFSAKLWVQAGKYVEGGGDTTRGIGLKLQYKFTKTFRTWLTLSGQSDVGVACTPLSPGQQPPSSGQCVPAAGQSGYLAISDTTNSGSVLLGAGYRF